MKSLCLFILVCVLLETFSSLHLDLSKKTLTIKPVLLNNYSKDNKYSFLLHLPEKAVSQFIFLDYLIWGEYSNFNLEGFNAIGDYKTCSIFNHHLSCSSQEITMIKNSALYKSLTVNNQCSQIFSEILCAAKCSGDSHFVHYSRSEDKIYLSISMSTCISFYTKCGGNLKLNNEEYKNIIKDFCENKSMLPFRTMLKVTDDNYFLIRKQSLSSEPDLSTIYSYIIKNNNSLFQQEETILPGKQTEQESKISILAGIVFPNYEFFEIKFQEKIIKILKEFIQFLNYKRNLTENDGFNSITQVKLLYWFCSRISLVLNSDSFNDRTKKFFEYLDESDSINYIIIQTADYSDVLYSTFDNKKKMIENLSEFFQSRYFFMWNTRIEDLIEAYEEVRDLFYSNIKTKQSEINAEAAGIFNETTISLNSTTLFNQNGTLINSSDDNKSIHDNLESDNSKNQTQNIHIISDIIKNNVSHLLNDTEKKLLSTNLTNITEVVNGIINLIVSIPKNQTDKKKPSENIQTAVNDTQQAAQNIKIEQMTNTSPDIGKGVLTHQDEKMAVENGKIEEKEKNENQAWQNLTKPEKKKSAQTDQNLTNQTKPEIDHIWTNQSKPEEKKEKTKQANPEEKKEENIFINHTESQKGEEKIPKNLTEQKIIDNQLQKNPTEQKIIDYQFQKNQTEQKKTEEQSTKNETEKKKTDEQSTRNGTEIKKAEEQILKNQTEPKKTEDIIQKNQTEPKKIEEQHPKTNQTESKKIEEQIPKINQTEPKKTEEQIPKTNQTEPKKTEEQIPKANQTESKKIEEQIPKINQTEPKKTEEQIPKTNQTEPKKTEEQILKTNQTESKKTEEQIPKINQTESKKTKEQILKNQTEPKKTEEQIPKTNHTESKKTEEQIPKTNHTESKKTKEQILKNQTEPKKTEDIIPKIPTEPQNIVYKIPKNETEEQIPQKNQTDLEETEEPKSIKQTEPSKNIPEPEKKNVEQKIIKNHTEPEKNKTEIIVKFQPEIEIKKEDQFKKKSIEQVINNQTELEKQKKKEQLIQNLTSHKKKQDSEEKIQKHSEEKAKHEDDKIENFPKPKQKPQDQEKVKMPDEKTKQEEEKNKKEEENLKKEKEKLLLEREKLQQEQEKLKLEQEKLKREKEEKLMEEKLKKEIEEKIKVEIEDKWKKAAESMTAFYSNISLPAFPEAPQTKFLHSEASNNNGVGLMAYDITIVGGLLAYYIIILALFFGYFLLLKAIGIKCSDYFNHAGYKKTNKNYSFFIIGIIASLVFNLVIGFLLYKDILVLLVFAINSELMATGIVFHGTHATDLGPIGFTIFALLVSIKLISVPSPLIKIVCICIASLIFFILGISLSKTKIVQYESNQYRGVKRRPVERMQDESIIMNNQ